MVCQLTGMVQGTSASELLQELENNKAKSCKNADFKMFGLSLATINLFISIILSIITFKDICTWHIFWFVDIIYHMIYLNYSDYIIAW